MDKKRTFAAVFVAPLASIIVWFAIYAESMFYDNAITFREWIFLLVAGGGAFLVVSYVLTMFIGFPIHCLLTWLKLKHWAVYLVSGIAGAVGYKYVVLHSSSMPSQMQEVGYLIYSTCGAVISVAFWYIAVKPHNKFRQRTQKA